VIVVQNRTEQTKITILSTQNLTIMLAKNAFKASLLTLVFGMFFFIPGAIAQSQHTISGKITDDKGNGLSGVSISLKGTRRGATTDSAGNYSFSVPDTNAVLVFSFTGYLLEQVKVGSRDNLSLQLLPDNQHSDLGDVVVIGYGTKRKVNLTGAVSTISSKDLAKSPVVNLSSSLAGQAPGLIVNTRSGEPGNDDATILIRGKATLGNTAPLVVIDGVPERAGGLSRLNPADIESFTVLKDASGAIYGARAANGVILITTKRGIAGKPSLSFTTNWAETQPTRVPKMLNSYEYAVATNEYNQLKGQPATYSDADIQKYKDGSDPLGHPNTNWWKAVMKDWTLQQNQLLSLRGGSDKIKYFLSGQYEKQNGMYKGGATFYRQYQARANVDIQASESLKIGLDVLYRNEFRNSAVHGYDAPGIFSELWNAYPFLIPQYPDGKVGVGIGGGPQNSMVYILNGGLGSQTRNTDYMQTKASFNWNLSKITKGLFLEGYYAYDLGWFAYNAFNKAPPPAYSYNTATGTYTTVVSSIPPSLYIENDRSKERLFNIKLGYGQKWGDHSIDLFAAYEQYNGEFDTLSASRMGFLSNQIPQLFAGGTSGQNNYSSLFQTARQNYIGRISYNYRNKYLLDYNMRYDGSANFPSGKRFGYFPSVSAGWRLSQENFFHSATIDELKLRGSWGKTGNDAVPPFQYIQNYMLTSGQNPTNNYLGGGYFFGPNAVQAASFVLGPTPNPNITWEVSTSTDIGVEVQLLNKSVSLNIDVFRSVRTGILIPPSASTPDYTGLVLPTVNLGKVVNRGIDLDAAYNKRLSQAFALNIRGNFTFARNKVINMDEPANVPDYQKKTGYPIDAYLLYQSTGLFQTQADVDKSPHPLGTGPGDIKYKDANGDGKINALDETRTTLSITPEIMYGLSLGGVFKDLDFTIFFQGQARARALLQPSGLNMAEEFFTGRWQKTGDNKYPRTFNGPTSSTYGSNTYASDFWLRNDAFLRLKNVEIGYTLPKGLLGRARIQGARIYISGNNLLSFDKFGPSFDPEVPVNSDGTAVTNGRYYPQQRIINIGANITL
jgi:TonB-linked SusC/RagA family outer membrane protein